ncbi:spermatogenesis-associated protein 31E1 isoform X2 [Ochotona princeps]|nr:spermatogenesis-associated protein 31E1 isoform X2 [Ochotona princeps]
MKRIPAGPVPENSPPRNSYLASLGTAIPGFDRLSSSISLFFWWWPTAKALLLLTSPHGRCQQEHLSYHPPEAPLWGDATHRQVEAGGPSFISPAVQELLEMSISKRVELMLKAEEKTGSLLNQRRPSYILRSLGTLLRSLSNKQAATMPQPFWNLGNKPKQLPDPQHLSYSEVFGNDLEQKYSQLFWGLPSLHSESLVAAAWVSDKNSSVSRTPTVRFNARTGSSPSHAQSSDPSELSQAQPSHPQHLSQSQPLIQILPLDAAKVQIPAPIPCTFPNQPSLSLRKSRTCRTSCPTSQDKARSVIPTHNEEMDWPLQMPLHRRWVSGSCLPKHQKITSQASSSIPGGSQGSQPSKAMSDIPGESISPELQEQLGQQSHTRLPKDNHQGSFLYRIKPSQRLLTHSHGRFSQICPFQGKDKYSHSQASMSSALAGKSNKDVNAMDAMRSRRLIRKGTGGFKTRRQSKDLGQDEDDQKALSSNPGCTSVKVLEDDKEEAESDFFKPRKPEVRSYKPRVPEKRDLKKDLKTHLDRKLVQIKKGRIPVRVRRSWLAANYAFSSYSTPIIPRNAVYPKGQSSRVNTTQKTYFVNPFTRNMLETHIKRFLVKQGKNPYSHSLKPISLNAGAAQVSKYPQSNLLSATAQELGADVRVKATPLLGEPQKSPGEKKMATKSISPLDRPLSGPPSVHEEVQKALTVIPSGGTSRLSVSPQNRQEVSFPTEPLKSSLPGKFQKSKAGGAGRCSSEYKEIPTIAVKEPHEDFEHLVLSDSYNLEVQISGIAPSTKAKEDRDALQVLERASTVDNTMGANVLFSQIISVNLSLEPCGGSEYPQASGMFADYQAGEHSLEENVFNEVEVQVEIETEKDPQDQDMEVVYQDCTPERLPITDSLAAQASLAPSKSTSSSDASSSQGFQDHLLKAGWSQRPQEPRSPKERSPWKSEDKMVSPSDKREAPRRLRPGEQEERAIGQRATHVRGVSHPAWNRETGDTVGKKSLPFLPKKEHESSEGHNKTRARTYLQHPNNIKRVSGWEDTLSKDRPASATTQSQGSHIGRLFKEKREAQAQALTTVVGKIVVEQLGLQYTSVPSELKWYKEDPWVTPGKCSYYSRGSSHPAPRREWILHRHVVPQHFNRPIKSMWTKDRGSNRFFPSREPVSLSSSSQRRARLAGAMDYPGSCPRNSLRQTGVSSSQTYHVPHILSTEKSFLPRKHHFFTKETCSIKC